MRARPTTFLAALLAAVMLLPAAGLAQQAPGDMREMREMMMASMPAQIHVSGSGEARVTPDRATVQVGVQTRAATAAAASAENARKQAAIIQAIKALGVPNQFIGTSQYNVYPEMQHDPRGQARVTGYVVSNVVRVELQRLELVGRVIDAALAQGANQVNSLDFWTQDTGEARKQALEQAVSKARAEAEVIARAAGGSLGPLLEISSLGYMPVPPRPEVMARAVAGGAADATPVQPGQETIRASINARWLFVPNER